MALRVGAADTNVAQCRPPTTNKSEPPPRVDAAPPSSRALRAQEKGCHASPVLILAAKVGICAYQCGYAHNERDARKEVHALQRRRVADGGAAHFAIL